MVRSYFLNDVFWSIGKLFWLWIPLFFLKMLYKYPIPYKRTTLKPSSATRIEWNTGRSSRKTRFSLPEMCLNTIKLWRNNLNKRKLVFSNGQARVLESCSRMSWKSQSTESIQLIWWRLNAFALTNEPKFNCAKLTGTQKTTLYVCHSEELSVCESECIFWITNVLNLSGHLVSLGVHKIQNAMVSL